MNTTNTRKIWGIKLCSLLAASAAFFAATTGYAAGDASAEETPVSFTEAEYARSNNAEQGKNGWYYCYGKADGKYYRLTYSELDRRWETGDETEPYALIYENGAHPGGSFDVIKLWLAEADGTADVGLSATLAVGATDGVKVSILYRAAASGETKILYEKPLASGESSDEGRAAFPVRRGDILYFVLNNNGTNANDGTDFKTAVRFTKTGQGSGELSVGDRRVIDWTSYYGDKQGENDWYYCYGLPEKYLFLTYGYMNNSSEIGWRAGHDIWYQQITKESMHPGCYRWSTLRVWVAKQDGVVSLEGDIIKRVAAGDGVDAAIWLNGERLVSKHFEAAELQPYSIDNMQNIPVKKGDTIMLQLHAGKRYNSANDYTCFRVQIFWEEKGDNYDPEENYTKYLSLAQTEAEMIGVIEVPKKPGDFDKTK